MVIWKVIVDEREWYFNDLMKALEYSSKYDGSHPTEHYLCVHKQEVRN